MVPNLGSGGPQPEVPQADIVMTIGQCLALEEIIQKCLSGWRTDFKHLTRVQTDGDNAGKCDLLGNSLNLLLGQEIVSLPLV